MYICIYIYIYLYSYIYIYIYTVYMFMLARCLSSHENSISYMSGLGWRGCDNVHMQDRIDVMLRCGWVWGCCRGGVITFICKTTFFQDVSDTL